MSNKEINTGGPAFPFVVNDDLRTGMTLRQWYAGMAMQGMQSNDGLVRLTPEDLAKEAFGQADAMIEAEAKWTPLKF